MIIYKDPISILTRSDKPNENWTDETNVFIVDDESELGKKILSNQPFFDFVLGENGELIGINPTERPIEPPKPPTEQEFLKQRLEMAEQAIDFLLMNGGM